MWKKSFFNVNIIKIWFPNGYLHRHTYREGYAKPYCIICLFGCFSARPLKPWNNEVWNGNSESSAICQYVCQSVLFVQPIRSFNLISMLVHCLHMKITTCLLVLINQLRKLDNSFSCELVSSLSAYESCLIYLEQSCQSYIIPMLSGVLKHMEVSDKAGYGVRGLEIPLRSFTSRSMVITDQQADL